ncbi:MAG: hypothetical protein LLG06_11330 [Desulfobacteraceae bacterium]|nr:hypothetical protein [Desulfobacteraceae bacterium]
MPKALPKKYFPGYTAQIFYRKVDKWAERWKYVHPYYDTWEEAHEVMLKNAMADIAKFEKSLAASKRHLARVQKMKKPEGIEIAVKK